MATKSKKKSTKRRAARKLTIKDIHAAAERLRNWGKWGKDDEIGTLNYTSAADIVAAAQLVRKGKVISLALNFDDRARRGPRPATRQWDASIPFT